MCRCVRMMNISDDGTIKYNTVSCCRPVKAHWSTRQRWLASWRKRQTSLCPLSEKWKNGNDCAPDTLFVSYSRICTVSHVTCSCLAHCTVYHVRHISVLHIVLYCIPHEMVCPVLHTLLYCVPHEMFLFYTLCSAFCKRPCACIVLQIL